jgi:hypothetical protein
VGWRHDASRLIGRLSAAAETRWAPLVVAVAAFGVWWVQAVAIPLAGGRDFATYLGAYTELFQSDPIDLGYVLGRTPLSPLMVGVVLDPFHGALAEPLMSLLYAASVTTWFLAARSFGGAAALLTVGIVLLYPGYGIVMHELSSDSVFAIAFAGWSLLVVRVLRSPTPRGFALVGLGVALLVLVRPGNQVLLVLAVIPLLVRAPWRTRLLSSAAFVLAAVVLLGAWTVHNGVRYGDYTVARGGNTRLPFERAFLTDRIVRPDNGPSSRKLARAVRRELLPKEPYLSYGVHLDDFFSDPSPRMIDDLGALANRKWGWGNDARILRDVGIEAVRTHPGTYSRGVSTTVWDLLHQPVFRVLDASGDAGQAGGASESSGTPDTIVIDGRTLPRPTEGQRIPAAHEGGPTSPDLSIYTVWTSPTEHHLVFRHTGDQERYIALHQRMDELRANVPDRAGNHTLALRLNQASHWFPPPVLWLVLGIVGLAVRRPAGALALVTPTSAALLVIVLDALAIQSVPHYAVPAAPAFVLLAAGALAGPRRA